MPAAASKSYPHDVVIHPVRPDGNIFLMDDPESDSFVKLAGDVEPVYVEIDRMDILLTQPVFDMFYKRPAVAPILIVGEHIQFVDFVSPGFVGEWSKGGKSFGPVVLFENQICLASVEQLRPYDLRCVNRVEHVADLLRGKKG